jgi:uncharacterized protein YciI
MLWIISCVDKANTAAIREKHLQPHRDFLQSQKKILVLAGATQSDDGASAIGSLFVVNGVFASVTITRMRKGQWNPEAAEGA